MIQESEGVVLYSLEAEAAVIGSALLYGPEAYDAASEFVSADSFYDPLHAQLWRGIEKVVLSGKYIDVITLMEEVKSDAIDWAYVSSLTDCPPTPKRLKNHAKIIAQKQQERDIIAAGRSVSEIVSDGDLTIEQKVDQSIAAIESVVKEVKVTEPVHISEVAVSFIDTLNDRADGKALAGRPLGYPTLDRMSPNGMGDGKLVVVAARPSVGKSSFVQQLVQEHAKSGYPAAFIGMEMENGELVERTVANTGRVALDNLQRGNLSDDDWGRVVESVEVMRSMPLYLLDQPGLTLAQVSAIARNQVRKNKIKTLAIDYLQLMKGSNPKQERRTQLEEITRGLKELAKKLGITVVLLSQLNRDVEKRTNPRPMMADLKECGAIEEDADVIIFLWTHRKGENGEASIKGCMLGKNRGGALGEVALHFEGCYQRWSESTESLENQKERY